MTGFAYKYEVPSDPEPPVFTEKPELSATFELETVEYRGVSGHSEQLYNEVLDAIEAAESDQHRVVRTIVLGRETLAALDAWFRHSGGSGARDELPVENIVTVPGRMIHVPEPLERAVVAGAREGGRK